MCKSILLIFVHKDSSVLLLSPTHRTKSFRTCSLLIVIGTHILSIIIKWNYNITYYKKFIERNSILYYKLSQQYGRYPAKNPYRPQKTFRS